LRIRQAQMEAFSKSQEDAFVARMVRHLRDDFPEAIATQGLKEQELEPLVRQGMAEAEKYHVIYEDDIESYLECMILLGPRFDQDKRFSWADEILRRSDLDGEEKMRKIDEHLASVLEGLL
jgi:hypothetical protein